MHNKYKTIHAFIEHQEHLNYLDEEVIIHNIQEVLDCLIKDTEDFQVLTGGYMNPVFTFTLNKKTYVYRYPGQGSEKFINRKSEFVAHRVAKDLGLDESLIWINETGHKISSFIEGYRYFSYDNNDDVTNIVDVMRNLHQANKLCGIKYDVYGEIEKFYKVNKDYALKIYPDLENIKQEVESIYHQLDYDNIPLTLCHNDVYTTNILIKIQEHYLIDWEFAKDAHPALDLTTFIVCSPYDEAQIDHVLKLYLQENFNDRNELEYYQYFAVGALYWLLWALQVEADGGDTEGFVEKYYHYLIMFIEKLKTMEDIK